MLKLYATKFIAIKNYFNSVKIKSINFYSLFKGVKESEGEGREREEGKREREHGDEEFIILHSCPKMYQVLCKNVYDLIKKSI